MAPVAHQTHAPEAGGGLERQEGDSCDELGLDGLAGSRSSLDEEQPPARPPIEYVRRPSLLNMRKLSNDTLDEVARVSRGPHDGRNRIGDAVDLEEVPAGILRQAESISEYKFPDHRLRTVMANPEKEPLVIVACGSFSPITYLHLRIFEMALDNLRENSNYEVMGGYYSPVSDAYKKPGLAAARHRVRMCELAAERTSSWLMVDAWESLRIGYTPTARVLDHFDHELNQANGGMVFSNGKPRKCKIMLLAGGDLIESMGEPDVWSDKDLHHILGNYGALIVERTGSDVWGFLLSHDILYEHRKNIVVIKQLIYNDISSTKVRLFFRRGMSVQYLLPNSVIKYIETHKLFVDSEPVKSVINNDAA